MSHLPIAIPSITGASPHPGARSNKDKRGRPSQRPAGLKPTHDDLSVDCVPPDKISLGVSPTRPSSSMAIDAIPKVTIRTRELGPPLRCSRSPEYCWRVLIGTTVGWAETRDIRPSLQVRMLGLRSGRRLHFGVRTMRRWASESQVSAAPSCSLSARAPGCLELLRT
jgi:hypothetical protein